MTTKSRIHIWVGLDPGTSTTPRSLVKNRGTLNKSLEFNSYHWCAFLGSGKWTIVKKDTDTKGSWVQDAWQVSILSL